MPKDNIERAIKKGIGETGGTSFDEITYEGYGPGGVAFMFERKGLFSVPAAGIDEEALMGIGLDAGADDIQKAGDSFDITCDPTAYAHVKAALEKINLTITHSSLSQIGKVPVDCDTETGQKVMKLLEALDDHDDVQNVYSNLNVTDAMMA
jgi:transcriptional/translational regulatory protein YebC/TACO1